jgi:hypothetical protein
MKFTSTTIKNNLPTVTVDQVIFNARDDGTNEVDLEFVYQIPSNWSKVSPYRVMVIMSDKAEVIHKFMNYELYTKHCISDEAREDESFTKVYLIGDDSAQVNAFNETVLVDKKLGRSISQRSVKFNPGPLPRELWSNLYIYAVAYKIDVQDVTKSGVSKKIHAIQMGTPCCETIYVRNQIPDRAVVYTLMESMEGYGEEGSIWTGPVHFHKGAPMAGENHLSGPHPALRTSFVSNQKAQDKTFMQSQGFLLARLNLVDPLSNPRIRRLQETARAMINTNNNGVSDVTFSRNEDNVVKAFFTINHDMFTAQNTQMSFLFTNRESLATCFAIEDIQIFRERIRPNISANSLTPGKLNVCGQKAQSSPKLVASYNVGVPVTAVNFRNQVQSAKSYVATDVELAQHDAGMYQYTIRIEGVDSSRAALQHLLHDVGSKLKAYDRWLKQNFYSEPFGRQSAPSDKQAGKKAEPMVSLKRRIQARHRNLQQSDAWINLVDSYLAAVTFIFGPIAFGSRSAQSWRKNLLSLANPQNGNIENMGEVSTLVRNFYSSLNQAVNVPTIGKSSRKFSVRSKIGGAAPRQRRVPFQMVFPSTYDNTLPADTGFEYMSAPLPPESPGLATVSVASFTARINAELTKFNVSAPNSNQVNKVGFLTPSSIKTPTNIINTTALTVGIDNTMDLLHTQKKPPMPHLSFDSTVSMQASPSANVSALLAIADVSIEPLIEDIGVTREIPTPTLKMATNLQLKDSSLFLSSGSVFLKDDAFSLAAISGSTEVKLKYAHAPQNKGSVAIQESGLAKTLINSQIASFAQDVKVVNMVGVQGSLAAKKLADDPSYLQQQNMPTNTINFNSIMQIQCFQGYEISPLGTPLIDRPRWDILTQEILSAADQAPLLCRLQQTTNVTNAGNALNLHPYNHLFMIGPLATNVTPAVTPQYQAYHKREIQQLTKTQKNVAVNVSNPELAIAPWQMTIPVVSSVSTKATNGVISNGNTGGMATPSPSTTTPRMGTATTLEY